MKNKQKKTKNHTTHYACKEISEKYGDKAIGCCCTGHECKKNKAVGVSQNTKQYE